MFAKYAIFHTPIIFDTVDVHFIREFRMLNITNFYDSKNNILISDQNSSYALNSTIASAKVELGHMKGSNITLVVSTEETKILKRLLGDVDVWVVSNIYLPENNIQTPPEKRSGAIFVGNMCHHLNVDAVIYIIDEILNKNVFPQGFKMHFVWSRSNMCPHDIMKKAAKHPMVV